MGATRPGGWQKIGVFSLYLGGTLEGAGAVGKMVAAGVNPESLPRVIEGLVNAYHADRNIGSDSEKSTGEDFSAWARTLAKDRLVKVLKEAGSGAVGTAPSASAAAPIAAAGN